MPGTLQPECGLLPAHNLICASAQVLPLPETYSHHFCLFKFFTSSKPCFPSHLGCEAFLAPLSQVPPGWLPLLKALRANDPMSKPAGGPAPHWIKHIKVHSHATLYVMFSCPQCLKGILDFCFETLILLRITYDLSATPVYT